MALSEGHPAFSTDKELVDQLWDFMMDERLPPYLDFVPDNRDKIYYSGINTQVCQRHCTACARHATLLRPSVLCTTMMNTLTFLYTPLILHPGLLTHLGIWPPGRRIPWPVTWAFPCSLQHSEITFEVPPG